MSSSLFSQDKFTQGEITMEVTDVVLSSEAGADSTAILENLKRFKSELNLKYVFTEDVFSIIQVKEDLFGMDTTLIVNDLVNLQTYLVQKTGYTKDTLIIPDNGPPLDVVIISEKELDEKLFGLSQVEYTCIMNSADTTVMVTTEDLLLPSIGSSGTWNSILKGTLLSMEMNLGVAIIKYEMTSFVNKVVDEKYISTDFSQMQDLTETAKSIFGEDTEEEDWVAELEKEYGEYQPQGTNNDILTQMSKEGYISEESIENILEEKRDVDIPGVIEKLGSSYGVKIKYFEERKPKSIISDFKKWGIYSPSLSTVLSDTSYWSSINIYDKVKVLKLASMHDSYMTETARQQIVDNAKSIRFITDAEESINKEFVKGEIGIDEWYGQYDTHIPLKLGKSKDADEIYSIVQYMFDEAFKDQALDISMGLIDDEIVIESNSVKHVLSIEEFYEEDYESEYNEKEDRYEYKEDVEFNSTFYRKVVGKIKQVAADNGLPQGYYVYNTKPLGPLGFDEYDYHELIERFPSLDHFEERLYLKKMIKKVYDPWAKLNMSFSYHPDVEIGSHTTFGSGHLIDVNFDVQYVTTANKLKFIDFLKVNSTVYSLDAAQIKIDSISIMNNLMEGSENLIRYLGSVKITVSKVFSITPKSQYSKVFTEQKNSLSAAYYNIHSVLNGDLDISKFRYNAASHKEYFMFDGKECSIDPGGNNMMKFIGKHIHKGKSGKKIFRENTFSVTEEVYYYLLPEHAKMLKDLVNLPI